MVTCVHHGCLLGHTCICHGCLLTLTGSWVYCMHVRSSLVHTSSSVLHTIRWVLTVLVPRRVVPGASSRDLYYRVYHLGSTSRDWRLLIASPAIVPRLVTLCILYIIRLLLSPNFPHIYPVNFHNIGAANIHFESAFLI